MLTNSDYMSWDEMEYIAGYTLLKWCEDNRCNNKIVLSVREFDGHIYFKWTEFYPSAITGEDRLPIASYEDVKHLL